MAVHRAVAADPGRAASISGAELAPRGSAPTPRDTAGSTAAGSRRGRPARAPWPPRRSGGRIGEGQGQRLLGVEVLARPRSPRDRPRRAGRRARRRRPRRGRSARGAAADRRGRRAGAAGLLDDPLGPRAGAAARRRRRRRPGAPGSSSSGPEQARPRGCPRPIKPSRTGRAHARRPLDDPPLREGRPAAAEQPRKRRRFRRIGGIGAILFPGFVDPQSTASIRHPHERQRHCARVASGRSQSPITLGRRQSDVVHWPRGRDTGRPGR